MSDVLSVELKFELERLAESMRKYGQVSTKTEAEIVSKQSTKLSYNVASELRKIAPKKGQVLAERLAALKTGSGVRVRPAVLADVAGRYQAQSSVKTGKVWLAEKKGRKVASFATGILSPDGSGIRLNLQALAVKRELQIRESARGFSGFAVPRPQNRSGATSDVQRDIESRYGFTLSEFSMFLSAEKKYAVMRWFGARSNLYESAVEGLSKPKQQAVVTEAVKSTTADIMEYVDRKLKEDIKKTF
jgi:hypothetical protein